MNKNVIIQLAVIIALLILSLAPAFSQEDSFVFNSEAFSSRQRPIPVFGHDEHMEYAGAEDCYVCHHLYENGKLVPEESSEDMMCSECHKTDPGNGSTKLLSAYHKLCQDCHWKQKVGPVTCGECHVK